MVTLLANRKMITGDVQEEVGTFPTVQAAEAEIARLESVSYVQGPGELGRPGYTIVGEAAKPAKTTRRGRHDE